MGDDAAVFRITPTPDLVAAAIPLSEDQQVLDLSTMLIGVGFRRKDTQLVLGRIVRVHTEIMPNSDRTEVQYFSDLNSSMGGLSGIGMLHAGKVHGILQGCQRDIDDNSEWNEKIRCIQSEVPQRFVDYIEKKSSARVLTRVILTQALRYVIQEGSRYTLHPTAAGIDTAAGTRTAAGTLPSLTGPRRVPSSAQMSTNSSSCQFPVQNFSDRRYSYASTDSFTESDSEGESETDW